MTNLNPSCCPELAEKISAFIDDELTPNTKEEVRIHITSCINCNETYEVELFLKQKIYESNQNIKAPEQITTWIKEELFIFNYQNEANND